ncbi:MAG: AMP-binding protein [Halieaceae bacterium]|jgi:carnitine-CoA ligase|nr:AMP-binding protein [Halieaceae bacterium]
MTGPTHSTLATLITDKARTNPDLKILTFVAVGVDGQLEDQTRTYRQLYENSQALARGLADLGVSQGDKLALMMNNHPEFVETMVASGILGATFIPIDPRTMGTKLSYMLDFTDSQGLICADYALAAVLSVVADCPGFKWLVVVPTADAPPLPRAPLPVINFSDLVAAVEEPLPLVEQEPADTMFMLFTSGTTGNPKTVIFSHQKYMGSTLSPLAAGMTTSDRYYTGLSLTHLNAQGTVAGALGQEIPCVLSAKFTKTRLWDIIRHYGCTTFNLLGGMIPEIYAMPEKADDADNPVRVVQSAGMPAHLWRKFEKRFGLVLHEVYGATEGGAMRNPPGEGPVGSIGKPVAGWVAEILDETGAVCPANVEGEICFRKDDNGPIVVQYYKNIEASADKVREGWLHMGDLGHKDENGWFYFHHRVGGGVRRNGDFVNTTLVETVLMDSPLVADVFVYGVATDRNVAGEKTLVAAVVPADPSGYDSGQLLDYCYKHLEHSDVPEIFQVLDEIPKTISEKPVEKACIDLLESREYVSRQPT